MAHIDDLLRADPGYRASKEREQTLKLKQALIEQDRGEETAAYKVVLNALALEAKYQARRASEIGAKKAKEAA